MRVSLAAPRPEDQDVIIQLTRRQATLLRQLLGSVATDGRCGARCDLSAEQITAVRDGCTEDLWKALGRPC